MIRVQGELCILSIQLGKLSHTKFILIFVVHLHSHVSHFTSPWTAACQASLSFTTSQSWLKFVSIASVMPSSHLILWRPLLLSAHHLSHHQGLFQWVGCSHKVAKILSIQGWFHLRLTDVISSLSRGLSRVFSSTTVRRHQFFGVLPSLCSLILISDTQIKTWSITSQHLKHCVCGGSWSLPQPIPPGVTTVLPSNTMDLFFLLSQFMQMGLIICYIYICEWVFAVNIMFV